MHILKSQKNYQSLAKNKLRLATAVAPMICINVINILQLDFLQDGYQEQNIHLPLLDHLSNDHPFSCLPCPLISQVTIIFGC